MRVLLYGVRMAIVLLVLLDIRIAMVFAVHGLPVNAVVTQDDEGSGVEFRAAPWTAGDTLLSGAWLALHALLFGGERGLSKRLKKGVTGAAD